MKLLKALRLLLDIYGAMFLSIICAGAVFYGLFPYQSFLNLGSFGFYVALGIGAVLWLAGVLFFLTTPLKGK